MKGPQRDAIVATGVVGLLLLSARLLPAPLAALSGQRRRGDIRHRGGAAMLVPLAYPIAKRVSSLGARITAHVSMNTLLTLHVYAACSARCWRSSIPATSSTVGWASP